MPLTAQQAFERAEEGGDHVVGWKLDREQRKELLMQFPPRYAQAVADHVTLASRVAAGSEPPSETTGEIVGRADDDQGVEAMIVRVGDTTDRPGGGTFHITWSLGRRAAGEGKQRRHRPARLGELELPMPVLLAPACWLRRADPS
jgi:hypothetical protein